MGHKKRSGEVRQMVVEWDLGDPDQRAVWDYWVGLTASGEASRWVRRVLTAGLPGHQAKTVILTPLASTTRRVARTIGEPPAPPDDTEYVPVEDNP